jgi:hypothetical protein
MYLDTGHRNTKEDDALEAFLNQRPEEAFELVDAPPALAGERRDELVGVGVVRYKYWVHEHRLCELALALPLPAEGVLVAALQDGAGTVSSASEEREREWLTKCPLWWRKRRGEMVIHIAVRVLGSEHWAGKYLAGTAAGHSSPV